MHVTVLGAGSWGTTMASLLAARHPTLLWARNPDTADEINEDHTNAGYLPGHTLNRKLTATSDLEKAVKHAELLIVGVPTSAVRSTMELIAPWVHPWIPIVSLSKGLEQKTLMRMTQVIADVLPGRPVAALTGPNIAREILAGQAAAAVIATKDLAVARAIQSVLTRGVFRVYTNHDVIGCELGGALKNVVAIASGIAQGLGVGDNTRAMVMTRGLAELTRLGVAMGGELATFAGLAGMGDLITTCISPHSRNRHVGEQLGQGRKLPDVLGEMNMVAEGVKTATTARELAKRFDVPMPVCDQIYKVVSGKTSAARAYAGLLVRPGHESDPG
ncbi:NAD(P)H-dependent glycerol-3-phosphate dehydrogenase [Desertimonas flava]|jgi:glycerol-3-phosphate dehydrogenase (NAD(P)+)|uniref:NAD(P)H-dependent glycerol-3-phosphate dehydrogenase n=1 Tax=Desertimonas flava TaxID=2064846 RepID=UPI000E348ADB|nr:NAD(P)H-dependent glycerol-3-phosphate dehydrogenase [Desertimonas flava]